MKRIHKFFLLFGVMALTFFLYACSTSNETTNIKIKMPYDSEYFYSDEWTLETLTSYFNDLGFKNIRSIPCDPDEDNYEKNIFELTIETGLFSDDPWTAGEEFAPDAEISIYYNEMPLLTVDNCHDLITILSSKDMDYSTFAEKYDGRYVEFNAYVCYHDTYWGETGHVIDVLGGDYDGNSVIGSPNSADYSSVTIHIGDRTWNSHIDKSVQLGDAVFVSGKIDASQSKYFKELYVDTICMEKR